MNNTPAQGTTTSLSKIENHPALQWLLDLPMWACSGGTKSGKPDKSPRDWRKPWRHAKSNDPATWGTFWEIKSAALKYPDLIQHVGIIAGQYGVKALDGDNKTKEILPESLQEMCAIFEDSYQEMSLSGYGWRCLVKADVLEKAKYRFALEEGVDLEVFNDRQYVILTGNALNEMPIADVGKRLSDLVEHLTPEQKTEKILPADLQTFKGEVCGQLFADFARAYSIEGILRQHGYRAVGDRFVAPSSTSGMAGVVILQDEEKEYAYSHHGNDVLGDGHRHDAFDCFALLAHNGDRKVAAKEARRLLGYPGRATKEDVVANWQDSEGVLKQAAAALEQMEGKTRTKNCLIRLAELLYWRVRQGSVSYVKDSWCIMVNGIQGLKALGAEGGLTEIGSRLKILGEIGLLGRVSRNGDGKYASLMLRIPESPKELLALVWGKAQLAQTIVPVSKVSNGGDVTRNSTPSEAMPVTSYPQPSKIGAITGLLTKFALGKKLAKKQQAILDENNLSGATYTELREFVDRERDFDEGCRAKFMNVLKSALFLAKRAIWIAQGQKDWEALERNRRRYAIAHERLERIEAGERISVVMA